MGQRLAFAALIAVTMTAPVTRALAQSAPAPPAPTSAARPSVPFPPGAPVGPIRQLSPANGSGGQVPRPSPENSDGGAALAVATDQPAASVSAVARQNQPLPRTMRSLLEDAELPDEDEEGYRRRLRETESELDRLRRGLQSGAIGGGIIFPGRDPSSFQPFAPRITPTGEAKPEVFPRVSVSGFIQQDTGFFSQDQNSLATFGPLQNGADFRRARLAILGSATENINYIMEMDFALPGHPSFRDVWAEVTNIPLLGAVRVGYFKQPFSLEELTSARQLTFLERASPVNAFAPFRRVGVMTYNHNEDATATWAASVGRALADPYAGDIGNSGGYAGTGRVTWLPYYDEPSGGRYYLNLGAAYQYAVPGISRYSFRTIPEGFIGSQQLAGAGGSSGVTLPGPINGVPFFVDSGALKVQHFNLYGAELAGSWGSLNYQAEWMATTVNQLGNPMAFFQGAYFQGSYFLTGEHRPLTRPSGTLGSIKPFEDFFVLGKGRGYGKGAWEIASRISWIDLNSKNVHGGRLTDYTAGLNWYLHANLKLQFNYVHAFLMNYKHGPSNTDLFLLRMQAQF